MAQLTLEEQLHKIFANVNDWLKFSEAKNAMLIAFNSASIFGTLKMYDFQFIKDNPQLKIYLMVIIIMLIFSTVLSLISFAPRVKMVKEGLFADGTDSNVLFFEYLKNKTAIEILKEISGETDEKKFTKMEIDIAEQIKQNSIVASRKFSYFTISVWITIVAYITIPLAGIFCLYTYINKK